MSTKMREVLKRGGSKRCCGIGMRVRMKMALAVNYRGVEGTYVRVKR
jgi:hypothetical protein